MDRLYVYYEKIRNIVRKRGFLCRLVQGWKVAAVVLACYGWWGVIYPELTMLPSTYEIVYEEQAEETKTVQKDAEVVEWNSDSQIYWKLLGSGSGTDPLQEQTACDVKKIEGEIPCIRRI